MTKPKPPSPKALKNYAILKIYATILCSLILLFVLSNIVRKITKKHNAGNKFLRRVPGLRALDKAYRSTHHFAGQKVPGLPSLGHAMVISFYIAVNIVLSLVNHPGYELKNIASRLGFMGAANMALATFFGLKNTPLAILTADTYNRLNFMHRTVGYTTMVEIVFHACLYAGFSVQSHKLHLMTEENQIKGIIAGISMLVMTFAYFRHRNYELFYVSHIVFFILLVITVGLHRPKWELKLPIIATFTACIWSLDRILRASRFFLNLVNNEVTLYPLPHGGVRVLLRKPLAGAVPGSHCFLWIPRIRVNQTHPFTIVSNSSSGMELVMGCHDGFTKAALEYATKNPGKAVFGAVEGPYGSPSGLEDFNRFIFISGGSGASYTFGLAHKFMDEFGSDNGRTMDFIWTVRESEKLDWYSGHLHRIQSSNVDVSLYVTGNSSAESSDADQFIKSEESPKVYPKMDTKSIQDLDQSASRSEEVSPAGTPRSKSPSDLSHDKEKSAQPIRYERLNVEKDLRNRLRTFGEDDRVLIAVCGPVPLVRAVEEAVRNQMSLNGPRLEVHSEAFDF